MVIREAMLVDPEDLRRRASGRGSMVAVLAGAIGAVDGGIRAEAKRMNVENLASPACKNPL